MCLLEILMHICSALCYISLASLS